MPSPSSRTFQLKSLLLALPLIAVLPLLLFSVALAGWLWGQGREDAVRDLQQVVGAQAVAVDRELTGLTRELQRIADGVETSPERLKQFDAYSRSVVAASDTWEAMLLIAPDGRVLSVTSVPAGTPTAPMAPLLHSHLRKVLETGRPLLSDVYVARIDGAFTLAIAVPVLREGRIAGVLSGRLKPDVLSRLLANNRGLDLTTTLLDRNYVIAGRSRDAVRRFGEPIVSDRVRIFSDQPEGATEFRTTLDGFDVLGVWKRLASGWTIVVFERTEVYQAPLRRSILIVGLSALAVLLVGQLLSVAVGRRLATLFGHVKSDAIELASGRALPPRHSAIVEFADLYQTLEATARELDASRRAGEQAFEALRDIDRRKDEFLAVLAHELRNPLAPIRNSVALLAGLQLTHPVALKAVAMSERQVNHLTRLVDDLLDVSRITQGKIDLKLERVELTHLVREVTESLEEPLRERGLRRVLECEDGPVHVQADPVRMAQIMENLIANAIKYTDRGGTVTVSVLREAGQAVLKVCDTGIGIEQAELPGIFDLFRQIDTTVDRAQGGLGIGLALVKRLVALHGGSVSARSQGRGQGSCFEVRLPISPDRGHAA
jgi:signal transduction histidine kinase